MIRGSGPVGGGILRSLGTCSSPTLSTGVGRELGSADGVIRLHADTLEVLWAAPVLDADDDDTDTMAAPDTGPRSNAITALAEALENLVRRSPSRERTIGIDISPNGPGMASEHAHMLDISPAMAHRIADHLDAMSCFMDSERPDSVALGPETIADLTELFEDIDLIDLTNTVLNTTRPEHRLAVTRAMDDLFGDIPATEDTDP